MANELSATESSITTCGAYNECTAPVDIILKSSEGTLLGAHMKNLENFNNAFPIAESVTHQLNEPVALSESATILRLILKFSHNEDCSISNLDLESVIALTDAADKYGNYPALNACRAALTQFTPVPRTSKIRLMSYRLRYTEVDESLENLLRSTMNIPLRQLVGYLDCFRATYVVYTVYRELWHEGIREYRLAAHISTYKKFRLKHPGKKYKTGPINEIAKASSSSLLELKIPKSEHVNHILDTTIELAKQRDPDLFPYQDDAFIEWLSGMLQAIGKLPTWERVRAVVEGELG